MGRYDRFTLPPCCERSGASRHVRSRRWSRRNRTCPVQSCTTLDSRDEAIPVIDACRCVLQRRRAVGLVSQHAGARARSPAPVFFVRLVRVLLHLDPTCTRGNTQVLRVLRFSDRRSPFSPRMSRRRCSLFHRPGIRHVHLECSWSGRTVLSRWDLFPVCFQGRQ